jgi:hypothetical protein
MVKFLANFFADTTCLKKILFAGIDLIDKKLNMAFSKESLACAKM